MRSLMHSLVVTMSAFALAPASAQYSPVWDDYAANPDAHPNIPNVSHAGYRGGAIDLPDGSGSGLFAVTNFGATGDGVTDDTDAVRAAIAAASAQVDSFPNGSTVLFPSGTYRLTGPLLVHSDKIHLRGLGEDQTELFFDASLTSGYAELPGGDEGDSGWSFSGGMIWFTDAERVPYYDDVPTLSSIDIGFRLSLTRNVTSAASLGDRVIEVSSTSGYEAGDPIVIEIDNDDDFSTLHHLLGDGEWAQNYMFVASRDGNVMPSGRSSWRVYHTIESIDGDEITLREPLRFDLRPEWDPEIRKPSQLRRDVGVSNMTIRLNRDYEWLRSVHHNQEVGFNGVAFTDTVDGFIEDVTILDTDGIAVFMNYCKNITVHGVTVDATGPDREKQHHAFGFANSADCLVEDFEVRSWPLHGIYFGNFCVNNVYSRGVMHHGTFDYHKRLPYANVYTEIDIINDGDSGGGTTSGPQMGARHVHWNIDLNRTSSSLVAQPDVMPAGALVGIQCATEAQPLNDEAGDPEVLSDRVGPYVAPPSPPNLYEAQLALRLGQPIPTSSAPPPCDDCDDDTAYAFGFGGGQIGQPIVGQDNWVFSRDFSMIDGDNARLQTTTTHPDGPLRMVEGRSGRDSVLVRQNDAGFAFTPHRYTAENATMRFDARAGAPGGSSGNVYLIVNNSDGRSEGIQFGMNSSDFQIRGGQFSNTLNITRSIPSGWYTRGEWARLELRIDFTAGADGEASLFFMNLSDGDTTYRAVPDMQNVPLVGEVRYPETWDRIGFRLRNAGAATNIVANGGAVIDACCEADRDGDNVLTADGDLADFVGGLEAADPTTDMNQDGSYDAFDLLAYLDVYNAGCP